MRIKKIHIQNYKSLVDFQLENMPQFCAFVGPNASGKSNVFEALEFVNYYNRFNSAAFNLFGGEVSFFSYKPLHIKEITMDVNGKFLPSLNFKIEFISKLKQEFTLFFDERGEKVFANTSSNFDDSHLSENRKKGFFDTAVFLDLEVRKKNIREWISQENAYEQEFEIFFDNFYRIFVGKSELKKVNQSSDKLLIDGSNLSRIVGQIFENEIKREDFIEWLRILIPEFKNIEVKKNNIDGGFHIFVYEKGHSKPFPINLLSDGTKNILSLMAAVYQSSEPQFLCIEEPENGLHPQAIELLVDFFREKCETEGHHIWLNTHSQTLVRCLEINEVITVNKVNGETKARQFKKEEAFNMKMDEAWLTNALGGGVL